MDDRPDRDDLVELLDPLAESARRDYIAVEIDGVNPSAQADNLGISPATVSANVTRAKAQLRELYDLNPGESLANAYGDADAVFLDVQRWALILDSLEAAAALRQQQGGDGDAKELRAVVEEMKEQLGRKGETN